MDFIHDQLLYSKFLIQLYFKLAFIWICFLFTLISENTAWVSKSWRYLENTPRFSARGRTVYFKSTGLVAQIFFFFYSWLDSRIYPALLWHVVFLCIVLYLWMLPDKPLNIWVLLVNVCQKLSPITEKQSTVPCKSVV